MIPSKNNKVCPMLWKHLHIETSGKVTACCEVREGVSLSEYKTLNDLYNSDYYKKMRLMMLNGEEPAECKKKCFDFERVGIESKRLFQTKLYNKKYGEKIYKMFSTLTPDADINDVDTLDFKPSNYCNSMCVMCHPDRSSSLATERKKLGLFDGDILSGGWYKKEHEKIVEIYKNKLWRVKINGGETSILPELKTILEDMKDTPCRLLLNVNNTVSLKKYEHLLSNKQLRIVCSIEGFGKVNEFIRYPANWETVYNHIKEVNNWVDEKDNITAIFGFTIMNLNYLHIPYFLENMKNNFPNLMTEPYVQFLSVPSYMKVDTLPKEIRVQGYKNFLDFYNKQKHISEVEKNLYYKILLYYKSMSEKEQNIERWYDFKKYINLIEFNRNMFLKDYIPEIDKIVNNV